MPLCRLGVHAIAPTASRLCAYTVCQVGMLCEAELETIGVRRRCDRRKLLVRTRLSGAPLEEYPVRSTP